MRAQRLLIATGVHDELPAVEGLERFWGDAVFHCPYCHGCEIGRRRVGVLAVGDESVAEAHLLLQWAGDVVLLLNEAVTLDESQESALRERGIAWAAGKVATLMTDGDSVTGVRMTDGSVTPLDQLLICPTTRPNRELLDQLDVTVRDSQDDDGMWVPSDDSGLTDVAGVWVAGNVRDGNAQMIDAAAQGLKAAIAVNADLTAELVRSLEKRQPTR